MTPERPTRAFLRAAIVLALVAGAPHTATGGGRAGDTASSEGLAPSNDADRARLAVAATIGRVGVTFIRTVRAPTPGDYRLAAMILEEARSIDPADQDLLRRLIEAYHAAGDDKRMLELTAELVRLDPADTVAQLRLISLRINQLQDVTSRLALYDRLLGPAGETLDASVRSRLALDDAMLARESGDAERFLRRLTQAVQLDSTNKDAAAFACAYGLARTDDPLARVELLANVVLADPIDAGAHLALARELLHQGAFRGAMRFFDIATSITATLGETEPDYNAITDTFVAHWGADGAINELDKLNEEEKLIRYIKAQQRAAYEKAGQDPGQAGEYYPSLFIELVRVLCAASVDRAEDAASAMGWITRATEHRLGQLADAVQQGSIDAEIAQNARLVALTDRLGLRLWSGQEIDGAKEDFEAVKDKLDPDARTRYEGLLAVRTGNLEEAVRLLTPLADTDPRARIGLGMAAEAAGDKRRAIAEYARVVLAHPGADPQPLPPIGLWARSRIEMLLGEKLRPTPAQQAVEDYVARLPRELDLMAQNPASYMALRVEQVIPNAEPFDRCLLRVTLTNVGAIPLAVGPSAPINSSLLLTPRIFTSQSQLTDETSPEVVSLDRRLSLAPTRSISAVLCADQGQMSNILNVAARTTSSVRWGVLQGFQRDAANNTYTAGPMCLQTESDVQSRRAAGRPGQPIGELLRAIREQTGTALLETILEARFRLWQQELGEANPDDAAGGRLVNPYAHRELIAKAIADRWPSLSEREAVFVLIQMPPAITPVNAMREMKVIDDLAVADERRLVRMMVLLLRVMSGEDDLFDQTIERDIGGLRDYATLLRDRRRLDTDSLLKGLERQQRQAEPAPGADPWSMPAPSKP